MAKRTNTKSALFFSIVSLFLCFAMLLGTTLAWFTDSVTSTGNKIEAGTLKVDLWHLYEGNWVSLKTETQHKIFNYDKWEPGYTRVETLKVENQGTLALKYMLALEVAYGSPVVGENGENLADVIEVYISTTEGNETSWSEITASANWTKKGTLTEVLAAPTNFFAGELLATKSQTLRIALHMQETAGNEYQNLSIGNVFVSLVATQLASEDDSFDNTYDQDATLPGFSGSAAVSLLVDVDANGYTTTNATATGEAGVTLTVPAGTKVTGNRLTLNVDKLATTSSNIQLSDGQSIYAYDVHVLGVAEDNTTPVGIYVPELAAPGLNRGNYSLYHVEDGVTVEMQQNDTQEHNTYGYDPATGDVSMGLAGFSEVAVVADTENAWKGAFDDSWYDASKNEFSIANADQLAAFGAIVGGMKKVTKRENNKYSYSDEVIQDSFSGKTVKLLADINLGDAEENNNSNIIFYPIGYYNSEGTYERTNTAIASGLRNFEGTFDGNGHTISNFYHNTWEMKGDNNYYDATLQYYRDGMGLFGRVYGGTIKNLTVKNFSSDGEYTTTGVIAAYADFGATFENIAIFDCNPRVYNIGNGGIVGCVGWYTKGETETPVTFKNITVDNSNKISALWGSYDVACGGIVGQYYPTSGQTVGGKKPVNAGIHMENCHVSAQMDVYNDVCANYQYYAYRYTGMLIGSVRENETIDGHVYPKMDGITAKDCTVHFGTWNDYYYCEIIDNTTASYTHDYQMSRLTEIKAIDGTTITYLDGTTGTVPASGRANYVIVDYTKGHGTENATCYHFKDGAVWNHEDAGYHDGTDGGKIIDENGDGNPDLREDKQHIYLEFNNLVTGYGWGVTTKGVGDLAGVTILDREVANSVEKFVGKVTELANNKEYKLGDIFSFVDKGVELVPGALAVAVNNLDENNPVSATIVYDRTNWENGTITFTGAGEIKLTIQDYYFCQATTITVNVTERTAEEKFDVVMNNGDFLHRVGNSGTVALDKLFKAKDGVTVGTVSVTVEAVNGTSASGTYSNNAIQFNGTGVVKVTITDNDYCIPTELYLEVVDATNLTKATGTTTGGNFVLLCDVNTSAYVNYWNCTLYGNGFTYSLKGAPTAYNSKHGHGVIITKNATLDNLVIIGDVYNSYGAYTNQDYYNTAIDVVGDTTIQNCYIANCAAPVKARSNVTIKNTTLYGGTVANLLIMSGTAILENVTTANYDDGRAMVGMGIVIHSDATETAKLVLNGTLTQYNFISESKVPTDTYAKNLHNAMFSSDCSQYQFGTSPNRYVNTGIISLTSTFNGEDITDNAKTGYVGKSLSVSSYDGYVYTQSNTSGAVVNNNSPEYKPTTQGAVPPSYSFDYTNKNYVAKVDGSNDYCYAENGTVNISMDAGDTFNWNTSILTIGKGITNYTVSMNGTDYTGKSIAFNTVGDYTVTYTYTDANNYKLDENGNITTYSVTYTKTVNIVVAVVEATTKHAEFTFGSSNTASTTVTVGNNTYVMPNVSGTSTTIGSTTVDGKTIYYPIVEIIMSDGKTSHTSGWYAYFPVFSGAVTITDYADNGTGDKMTPYNGSTTTMPSGLSVVGDPTQLFKYQSASAAGSAPVVKSNKLVYSSASISAKRSEYNTVVQYSYTDNAGATYYYYIGYHAPAQSYSSICVTEDTLITLADGTQKEIQDIRVGDEVLAWNFYTGKYEVMPVSLLQTHSTGVQNVLHLYFEDGTELKVLGEHGIFDADAHTFIFIDEDDVDNYIGHNFVKQDGDSFITVKLVDYEVTTEYTTAYTILSADHYNVIAEGMFTVTPAHVGGNFFNPFDIDSNMKYDEEAVKADIEKYGLYTYEDFDHVLTYEQFVALNLGHFKVSVGKGYITYEGLIYLIENFVNNEDFNV